MPRPDTRVAPAAPPRPSRHLGARPPATLWALLLCAGVLSACGGGASPDTGPGETSGSSGSSGSGTGTTVATVAQPANTAGRLLASNCFQCHGTGGMGGFEAIRGSEAAELREFRDLARKPARSDIMAAHAQGYTDAQVAAIVQYLQQ
jgi:mono/diheme cytochrome c family protein